MNSVCRPNLNVVLLLFILQSLMSFSSEDHTEILKREVFDELGVVRTMAESCQDASCLLRVKKALRAIQDSIPVWQGCSVDIR